MVHGSPRAAPPHARRIATPQMHFRGLGAYGGCTDHKLASRFCIVIDTIVTRDDGLGANGFNTTTSFL